MDEVQIELDQHVLAREPTHHNGHLAMLSDARKAGDVLIVGLRSDASGFSSSGPGRPFVPERQRAEMLLALRTVDYVHIFDEVEPVAFLREIRPDAHVSAMGGDEHGIGVVPMAFTTRLQ